jgi:acyl-coenzyme A synthetase/AMP-(fatty) acid ligase
MDDEKPSAEDLATLRAVFENGEPLGWDAVYTYEAQHGVVLPEPYRTFVVEICDGSFIGPPDGGLMELGRLPDDWGAGRPARDLAKPFPLTEPWVWEDEEHSEEELDALLDPVFNHGSLVLGTDGCGMYWHLVVTGAHRGHIWCVTDVGAYPYGAEFDGTTGRSGFAGWVEYREDGEPV